MCEHGCGDRGESFRRRLRDQGYGGWTAFSIGDRAPPAQLCNSTLLDDGTQRPGERRVHLVGGTLPRSHCPGFRQQVAREAVGVDPTGTQTLLHLRVDVALRAVVAPAPRHVGRPVPCGQFRDEAAGVAAADQQGHPTSRQVLDESFQAAVQPPPGRPAQGPDPGRDRVLGDVDRGDRPAVGGRGERLVVADPQVVAEPEEGGRFPVRLSHTTNLVLRFP